MHIYEPDRHPGRCLNHRTMKGHAGYPKTVRCLDYEGTPHVCTFPEIPQPPLGSWGTAVYANQPKPTPWVKPGAGSE